MQDITVVLLSAGSATRFQNRVKKQWLRIGDMPLWKKVERDFRAFGFANILIVGAQRDCSYMQKLTDATVIAGGQ
ncbi:MAG: NTP transferase domain-containing protein, partial [Campylobacterota bacterium]